MESKLCTDSNPAYTMSGSTMAKSLRMARLEIELTCFGRSTIPHNVTSKTLLFLITKSAKVRLLLAIEDVILLLRHKFLKYHQIFMLQFNLKEEEAGKAGGAGEVCVCGGGRGGGGGGGEIKSC